MHNKSKNTGSIFSESVKLEGQNQFLTPTEKIETVFIPTLHFNNHLSCYTVKASLNDLWTQYVFGPKFEKS